MQDHPAFAGRPESVKIASNGVWEQAVVFPLDAGLKAGPAPISRVSSIGSMSAAGGSTSATDGWMSATDGTADAGLWSALQTNTGDGEAVRDIACEAFFGDAFFGIRQYGTPDQLEAFVNLFVVAVTNANSGPDLFGRLAHELDFDLAGEFLYCELGAEGAWRSVGPLRIEKPCEALRDRDVLWARIAESQVGQDTQHPKALEFSFSNTGDASTHWFALPVSRGTHTDRDLLELALAAGP